MILLSRKMLYLSAKTNVCLPGLPLYLDVTRKISTSEENFNKIINIFFFTLSPFHPKYSTGRNCNTYCYWDYYNNYVCDDDCNVYGYDREAGSWLSFLLAVLNISVFIKLIIATVYLGCGGCCGESQNRGNLLTK